MRISITYVKIYSDIYAVYRNGINVGVVRKLEYGWQFRTTGIPVYTSPVCDTKLQAVLEWPELENL